MIFENFASEKEFYRKNTSFNGGNWESHQEFADQDIVPFLRVINCIDFTFSKNMSCSGSYLNHSDGGTHMTHEEAFQKGIIKQILPNRTLHFGGSFRLVNNGEDFGMNFRFGLGIKDIQGYAVLRCDTSHKEFKAFTKILTQIPRSLFIPLNEGIRKDVKDSDLTPFSQTFSYQVFMPDENNRQNFEDIQNPLYMTHLWYDLATELSDRFL